MTDRTTNIRLAGVGGQGILVAGEILGAVLLEAGYDVKKSEIHGMAQRGGTVNTDIRFGEKVYSPIIPDGSVDMMLAFEQMEALRYLPSLNADGLVIVNEQRILPSSVASGNLQYPEGIIEQLSKRAALVISLDALSVAKAAGSARSVNMCLLGALSTFLDVDQGLWEQEIRSTFRRKNPEANLKAFEAGRATAAHQKEGA